jgi:hypothetical protein
MGASVCFIPVHDERHPELPQIAQAFRLFGAFPRPVQGGQQDRDQQRDNANDDE